MAFTAITTTEVDVDSPVSDELMEKMYRVAQTGSLD